VSVTDTWGFATRGVRVAPRSAAPVLIVDDDPAKRLALKAALSQLDLDIVEADSGETALRRVMEQTFAVILLDVRMPEMDGFETAALIRTQRESEMTPIIFVTAFASDEIEPTARYVEGAVDFIFAPVPPDELRAKVSVFVNLFVQASELASAASEVKASADDLKVLVDASPIGIFRTDAADRFVYTNPRWSEISGFSAEEALGQEWEALVRGNGGSSEQIDTSIEGVDRRSKLNLKDGTERFVIETSETIRGDLGEVAGWVGTIADTTMEILAEEERSRYRALVQNSRDVIAIIDESGMCSFVSPGVTDVSGFSPDEVIGRSGIDFIHPEDLERVVADLAEIAITPDATKIVEVRTRTKSGEWIWIEIRAANRLEDPSIRGIVLNYHDITGRRESRTLLAENEKLLAEGQAISHLGSFTWDMRTDELAWSDEQYRLLGFEPRSINPTLKTFTDCLHPGDRDVFMTACRASMETLKPFYLDLRVVLPDGTLRWILSQGEVVTEDGKAVRLVGMSHDITVRKEAEEERASLMSHQRDLAEQLRMLLDSTGEGIFGIDAAGVCTFMNKAGSVLLGGTTYQFIGKNMHDLTHHSFPDGSAYPVQDCPVHKGLRTGEPMVLLDDSLWRLDGTKFPVDYSSYPIRRDGAIEGAVVTFQDTTLRRGMEQEVRQSEQLFRGAFDSAQIGIALTLGDGLTYVDVNRALCEMLGYTKEELLELSWQKITHPDDLERNLGEFNELLEGRSDKGETHKRYLTKNGEPVWVEINDSVVRGSDGELLFFVSHVNNVTEREIANQEKEKLETQLIQAQKMEAVGQLAGGVAHDFNNILSVILNYAEFASEDLESDDARLADIQQISKAGEKAAKLVHQLLAFSRKEIVEQRVIDLNEVVAGVYQILGRSLGEDIDLDFKAFPEAVSVIADPGRIEQVLFNLAVNARDAMAGGGQLWITTGIEAVLENQLPPLPAGDYAVVVVSDSGSGMDENTVERAFEPFFTTKARGEGTGMGLSSAYGIVEQAGGRLSLESEIGVGTKFRIYLPITDSAAGALEEELAATPTGGSETILLVEDEDAVRELVSRILVKQGYDVVPYSTGADALAYCRDNLTNVDLLLTDVVMPKMSGKELSEQATTMCVGLKTLFMSGYTDALIAQRGVLATGENLIAKPFKPEKLLSSVRSLLDMKVAS
jgi:two-component system NtrC family sensor kinase